MTEKTTELSRPLVVGRKRDGRNCYDSEAKRELVAACLRPGTSVSRMALEHGVNANLLRKWIDRYRATAVARPVSLPTFVPVLPITPPSVSGFALTAMLPNGVKLDLNGISQDALPHLLTCLVHLPCSASIPG